MNEKNHRYDSCSFLAVSAIFFMVTFIIIAAAIVCFRVRRRVRGAEGFFATRLSGAQRCARMDRERARTASYCDLKVPRFSMGRICVDGSCLGSAELDPLLDMSSELRQKDQALRRNFAQVNGRLDSIDSRSQDMHDSLESNFESLKENVTGIKRRLSSAKEQVSDQRSVQGIGGDAVYDEGGYRYHEFKNPSGTFHVVEGGKVDVFLVGGGAGGTGSGGGGGYTVTRTDYAVDTGQNIRVTVGDGGNVGGGSGGSSEFGSLKVDGGGAKTGHNFDGGSGGARGSGGSGCGRGDNRGGYDGSDGGTGWTMYTHSSRGRIGGPHSDAGGNIGSGQGSTTRAFGESDGKRFSAGGSSHNCGNVRRTGKDGAGHQETGGSRPDALPNSGGGGGGARRANERGKGGSGIVIVRYRLGVGNRVKGALDGELSLGEVVAAYSLRRLFGRFYGPQVRVSRSSDRTEAAVYFDENGRIGWLADEDGNVERSITRWLDGSTAEVRVLYDQSGNEFHQHAYDERKPTLKYDEELKRYGVYFEYTGDGTSSALGAINKRMPVHFGDDFFIEQEVRIERFGRSSNSRRTDAMPFNFHDREGPPLGNRRHRWVRGYTHHMSAFGRNSRREGEIVNEAFDVNNGSFTAYINGDRVNSRGVSDRSGGKYVRGWYGINGYDRGRTYQGFLFDNMLVKGSFDRPHFRK